MYLRNAKRKYLVLLLVLALITLVLFYFHNQQVKYKITAPTNQFRFIAMGDSRGKDTAVNEKRFRKLLQNISSLEKQPSFLLFGGDMVNGTGDVKKELTHWKKIAGEYYPVKKYYPAIGNHERDEKVFSDSFKHLPNEQLKGYKRTVYYFDYANSRFIVLNSNRRDKNGSYVIDDEQLHWLEKVLKQSDKTHHFIMFHVPAFPVGPHYGKSLDRNIDQRDALWSIIDQYQVTAVFVSHEHNYNRRLIDYSFNTSSTKYQHAVYQVTLGGAGAPLSAQAEETKNILAGPYKSFHYMVVDVIGGLVVFTVYNIDNNIIDSFDVTRGSR